MTPATDLIETGRAQMRTGQAMEAAHSFAEALKEDPHNLTILFFLGEAQAVAGDRKAALNTFESVIRRKDDFAPAHNHLGVLYRAEHSPAKAITHFRKAVELTPLDPGAHQRLAATYHQVRMTEASINAFKTALILQPDHSETLYNLGISEPLTGDRQRGLKYLLQALTLTPFSPGARIRIGRAYMKLGQSGAAALYFQQALVLDPRSWEGLYDLTANHRHANLRYVEAGLLKWLLILQPASEVFRIRHALALESAGNLSAAAGALHALPLGTSDYADEISRHLRRIMAAQGKAPEFQKISAEHPSFYERWISAKQNIYAEEENHISRDMASWRKPPQIDIVLPVYNPNPAYLTAAIQSVKTQSYPHWQLLIVDDASGDPQIRSILEQAAAEDSRIDVEYNLENKHISAASNRAIRLGAGDYITFLDHDDLLADHALYFMAREINANPDVDLLYSDEDKIDEAGNRFEPHFKPDWDIDLLRAQNFICHLVVYRRALVDKVGGLRVGYEGSQDHDLALRISEQTSPSHIKHVPHILYHWRAIDGSTAQDEMAKPYAVKAAAKAVEDHLVRAEQNAALSHSEHGFRLHWHLPAPLPHVRIIIPTRDRLMLLRRCIDGVLEGTDYANFSVLIVDNDSREKETLSYLEDIATLDQVTVLHQPGAFNYSALNNAAVAASPQQPGDILCFLNNDTEPKSPTWLREMIALAVRDDVGIVGAKLLFPNDTIQHAGLMLAGHAGAKHIHMHLTQHDPGYLGRARHVQAFSAVTGAAMVIARTLFTEVGGFDTETFPIDFSDVDLCLRVRQAGYKVLWTPHAVLYHHESASRGSYLSKTKEAQYDNARKAMIERYGDILFKDPFGNPNLDLEAKDWRPALPPRF